MTLFDVRTAAIEDDFFIFGEIGNSAELRMKLGRNENISDKDLFLSGVACFGNDFYKSVQGNWVVVLFEKRHQKITIIKSLEESIPFYYYHNGRRLIFSQYQKELINHPDIPTQLNEKQLVTVLNCLSKESDATAYLHIKRLSRAHVLTLRGSDLSISCYWNYDAIQQIRLSKDRDYEEQYLELYRASVNRRLSHSSENGVMLSGGLDSSSVAVLAAEELRKEGRVLNAYTSVPRYDTRPFLPRSRFGDESSLVDLLAKKYDNLSLHYIKSENFSPLDGVIKGIEIFDQPMHAAGNLFWLLNICSIAKKNNIQNILTGQHGNMGVSFEGFSNHFGTLPGLIRDLKYLKNLHGKNTIKVLLKTSAPSFAVSLVEKVSYTKDSLWQDFSAVNPDFAKKMDVFDVQPFSRQTRAKVNVRKTMFENALLSDDFYSRLKLEMGLDLPDPTYDTELIEYCFGIPDDQFKRHGIGRYLIRRVFDNKMPREMIWNIRRGRQSGDLSLRIADEYDRVNCVMQQLKRSDYAKEVLDLEKMQQILVRTQTERNPKIFQESGSVFLRGLMVGLFILRHEGDPLEY